MQHTIVSRPSSAGHKIPPGFGPLTPAKTLVISSTRIPSNGAIFPGEAADEETEARHLRRASDGVEVACTHVLWLRKALLNALLGAIVKKRGTIGSGE